MGKNWHISLFPLFPLFFSFTYRALRLVLQVVIIYFYWNQQLPVVQVKLLFDNYYHKWLALPIFFWFCVIPLCYSLSKVISMIAGSRILLSTSTSHQLINCKSKLSHSFFSSLSHLVNWIINLSTNEHTAQRMLQWYHCLSITIFPLINYTFDYFWNLHKWQFGRNLVYT